MSSRARRPRGRKRIGARLHRIRASARLGHPRQHTRLMSARLGFQKPFQIASDRGNVGTGGGLGGVVGGGVGFDLHMGEGRGDHGVVPG